MLQEKGILKFTLTSKLGVKKISPLARKATDQAFRAMSTLTKTRRIQ